MTGPYEWNPMPHIVSVRCPDCGAQAKFEFAEGRRIELRKDIAYFQTSKDFDYATVRDYGGGNCHVAVYYHGLGRRALGSINDLPDGYTQDDWQHSRYLMRSHDSHTGAISCAKCGLQITHHLDWPTDAFFQIEFWGNVLWAFDRESASELLTYIASEDRTRQNFVYKSFLMEIPTVFLTRKARETVVKKLAAVLAKGMTS